MKFNILIILFLFLITSCNNKKNIDDKKMLLISQNMEFNKSIYSLYNKYSQDIKIISDDKMYLLLYYNDYLKIFKLWEKIRSNEIKNFNGRINKISFKYYLIIDKLFFLYKKKIVISNYNKLNMHKKNIIRFSNYDLKDEDKFYKEIILVINEEDNINNEFCDLILSLFNDYKNSVDKMN